jgi:hypothetical protein
MPDPAVHRIVLTGGPCAGKTTALSHISERLQSLGVKVFIVPEAATILIGGGVGLRDIPSDEQVSLQGHLIGVQMALALTKKARPASRPGLLLEGFERRSDCLQRGSPWSLGNYHRRSWL